MMYNELKELHKGLRKRANKALSKSQYSDFSSGEYATLRDVIKDVNKLLLKYAPPKVVPVEVEKPHGRLVPDTGLDLRSKT